MGEKKTSTVEIINRKAKHEYHFHSELEAGILLTGTEIKSVRESNVNLRDAYCTFKNGELIINSLYIGEYKYGNLQNHETRRPRKLLLKKAELRKWEKRVKEKGYTIVPYRMYISERGLAKVEVALAQGKKSYDKRNTIKERDNKKDLDRLNKIRL
jgi:SsrA-binding protein